MVGRAVPQLDFEVVGSSLNTVHVDFILLCLMGCLVNLADESADEAGFAAARLANNADLHLDDFFPPIHELIITI